MPLSIAIEIDLAGLNVLNEHPLREVITSLGDLVVLGRGYGDGVAAGQAHRVGNGHRDEMELPAGILRESPVDAFRRYMPAGK